MIINGFKSAFIPYRERVILLNRALREMEELEQTDLKKKIDIEEAI